VEGLDARLASGWAWETRVPVPADKQPHPRKGNTMFSSTLKRSVATPGVVALLPAAAIPAGAAGPGGASPGQPNQALPTAAATSQGIIMRDGGICDPIRHMGC
jgi:hypothetical protein